MTFFVIPPKVTKLQAFTVAVQTIWNNLPNETVHKSVLSFCNLRLAACISWRRTFWTFD